MAAQAQCIVRATLCSLFAGAVCLDRLHLWASAPDRSHSPACRFSADGLHYMVASAPCVHAQCFLFLRLIVHVPSDASAAQYCMICDRVGLS